MFLMLPMREICAAAATRRLILPVRQPALTAMCADCAVSIRSSVPALSALVSVSGPNWGPKSGWGYP